MKSQTDRFLAENIKDNIIENLPETAEDIVKEAKKEKKITIVPSRKERLGMSSFGFSLNKLYNKIKGGKKK